MPLPEFVTATDVVVLSPGTSVEKATAMIRAVTARAVAVAPCIAGDQLTDVHREIVSAVLLDAVSRWAATGGGSAQQMTSGPFGFTADTRQERRGTFLKSEFDDLQAICEEIAGEGAGAFSISLYHEPIRDEPRPGMAYETALARGWLA